MPVSMYILIVPDLPRLHSYVSVCVYQYHGILLLAPLSCIVHCMLRHSVGVACEPCTSVHIRALCLRCRDTQMCVSQCTACRVWPAHWCVYVCERACVCVCERACVCACVRVSVHVCVCIVHGLAATLLWSTHTVACAVVYSRHEILILVEHVSCI